MQRVGGFQLRFRRRCSRIGGHRLQIGVRRDEHDEIAGAAIRVPRRNEIVTLGPDVVDRAQIENRLRQKDARFVDAEWTDNPRKGAAEWRAVEWKSKGLEVVLSSRCRGRSRDIGQQLSQRHGACAGCPLGPLLRQQHAEIPAQRPLDDVGHRQRESVLGNRAIRHTASKRTVRRQRRP
jgi:hypothetical protein